MTQPAPIETAYDDMNYSVPKQVAVCAGCVADSVLAETVKSNPLAEPCAFCGAAKNCGKITSVLEAIRSRFTEDWSEISEAFEEHLLGAPDYDDEEPGHSLNDLFEYAEYRPTNIKYKQALKRAFGDVSMHWRGSDDIQERDRHLAGWDRFKEMVRHERRFTVGSVEESPGDPHGIFETRAG